MALIRHTQAKSLARDAIVLDLGDLRRQADELKASAEAEAREIVREAHAERARILEGAETKGHEKGFGEGHAKGSDEGRQQGYDAAHAEYTERFETLTAALGEALDAFERAREDLLLHAEEDGLRLVLEIARRVTRRAVEVDPASLGERLGEAVRRVLDPSHVVVRVHPDDAAMARDVLGVLMSGIQGSAHSEVIEDETLTRGDATIDSGRGSIDARIDEQIGRMLDELMPTPVVSDESGEPG